VQVPSNVQCAEYPVLGLYFGGNVQIEEGRRKKEEGRGFSMGLRPQLKTSDLFLVGVLNRIRKRIKILGTKSGILRL
jgi:hypothetical protein